MLLLVLLWLLLCCKVCWAKHRLILTARVLLLCDLLGALPAPTATAAACLLTSAAAARTAFSTPLLSLRPLGPLHLPVLLLLL
jgi:hypothetical protein